MVVTKPTYHIVSRVPPPPQGPLKLGTVIDSLEDLNPLSNSLHVEDARVTSFHEEGFQVNWEQVLKGAGGVGTKLVTIPTGFDLSGGGSTNVNDTYKFKELDTTSFSPTTDDYQRAVSAPELQNYLKRSGYASVYIITGMKIGHQPQVTLRRGNQLDGTFTIGVSDGSTTIGVNANASNSTNMVQESESSPDSIVFAIRVRKLLYERRYYFAGQRDLHDNPHNYGAELVGVDRDTDEEDEVPRFDVKEEDLDAEVNGRTIQDRDDSQEGFQLVL